MHRFAEPVKRESSDRSNRDSLSVRTEEAVEGERRLWRSLAEGIKEGEREAEEAFRSRYTTGVRLLLRRNLGPVGLESLVRETLAGALEEIRRGVLREPRHFVHFVRAVVDRHSQVSVPGAAARPRPTVSPSDRMRLRETELAIKRALLEFTAPEREILTRYYGGSLTRQQVLVHYGIEAGALDELRDRMHELVRPERGRSYQDYERRAPMARGASAGID